MPRVYIAHRREDSAPAGRRIARYLTEQDITCVVGEADTRLSPREVDREIDSYDAVLVVIGKQWSTIQNRFGFAHLFEPDDPIRVVIEVALEAERPIFPILVNGATMPLPANVPVSLVPLLHVKPIVLRDDPDFEGDLRQITDLLLPGKPVGHQVFISYSRKDAAAMGRLRDDLRGAGVSLWVDEDGLEPGTADWETAVGQAIRGTNCVVVILSPDAEQSLWVRRELAMAETLGKRIFPILVRGDETDAIPIRLMAHQWVDGRGDYAAAISKLLGAVKKHLNIS